MSESEEHLFDPAFLARLEYLALVAKRIVRGELRAERLTQVRGGGVQFADFREYQPGDDFRYVDWHAYARLGHLFLKLFEEEQDLHVYFLLDRSRSMGQGDPAKMWFAKRITAALAYIVLSSLDRAGISLFDATLVQDLPMARGKGRILSLLNHLQDAELGAEPTDLKRAVDSFLHRAPRRGVVVLVSDLFDRDGYREALDRLRYSRHQIMVIQVLCEEDRNPDLRGDIDLEDVETGDRRTITVSERTLAAYREAFAGFEKGVAEFGKRCEVPILQVSSEEDLEEVVLRLFRQGGFLQ